MKIGITADHGGYLLKEKLKKYLQKEKYEVVDYGTNSDTSVDYPDYAFKLGNAINNKEVEYGIAICKTGIGMSISCNKIKGVMCAKIDSVSDAILAREHNGANVISFGANKSYLLAKKMIKSFLNSKSLNNERHIRRYNKIMEYNNER